MRVTLAELACLLAGELEGDGQTIICGIAPLDQAQTGDLNLSHGEQTCGATGDVTGHSSAGRAPHTS